MIVFSPAGEDVLEAPDGAEHAERGPDPDRADTP